MSRFDRAISQIEANPPAAPQVQDMRVMPGGWLAVAIKRHNEAKTAMVIIPSLDKVMEMFAMPEQTRPQVARWHEYRIAANAFAGCPICNAAPTITQPPTIPETSADSTVEHESWCPISDEGGRRYMERLRLRAKRTN